MKTKNGDRRSQAVLHAKRYTDHDEQLAFWAGFACALLLLNPLSDDDFQRAALAAHETVKEIHGTEAGRTQ